MASAQVIVRSQDGAGAPGGAAGDGAERDRERAAQEFFRSRGFEVTEPFAGSFSITAPDATFEATFGGRLRREGSHGAVKVESAKGASYDLSLDHLPPELADEIQVVFTPPPDFGPTSW